MEPTPRAISVSKKVLWTSWIVSAVPALMLLMSAVMKFANPAAVVEGFAKLGWPDSYAPGLGIVEVSCTLIYLVPRTSVLGAILLTGFLGGATATHVRIGDPSFVGPFFLGVLVWLGLYLREGRLRPLIPLRG